MRRRGSALSAWACIAAVALLASLLATSATSRRSSAQAPALADDAPNVLVILTDDQRFDMLQRRVMPHLAKVFADHGVHYRNAVATTPLCCPSRASIFSGKYVHNHGVGDNTPEDENWNHNESMPHELDSAGYLTGLAGKYFKKEPHPPDFDKWAVQIRPDDNYYYNTTWNVNGEEQHVGMHATNFARVNALRFLRSFQRQDDDAPWYLQISPLSPHKNWTPMKEDVGADVPEWDPPPSLRDKVEDKPQYVQNEYRYRPEISKKIHRKMLRSLIGVDRLIKSVFEWMRQNGEARDTLAFFMSDNGYLLGEHGLLVRKQLPYNESVRIPLFMRWPGNVPEGKSRPRIVANIDIAPTVYEATGIVPSYTVDGKSMLSSEPREHILIESEHDNRYDVDAWAGLWSPERVYTRYANGEREYYNVVEDPWELRNLLMNRNERDDPDTSTLDMLTTLYSGCEGATCP